MNSLSEYIIEKLVIDKDVQSYKYVIYYKGRNTEQYKEHIVIDNLREFKELRKNTLKDKFCRVFKCKQNLVDEFINRWDHFNPIPDDKESFWNWFERVGCKEIHKEDISKELH